jgi:hypothetical protein
MSAPTPSWRALIRLRVAARGSRHERALLQQADHLRTIAADPPRLAAQAQRRRLTPERTRDTLLAEALELELELEADAAACALPARRTSRRLVRRRRGGAA